MSRRLFTTRRKTLAIVGMTATSAIRFLHEIIHGIFFYDVFSRQSVFVLVVSLIRARSR